MKELENQKSWICFSRIQPFNWNRSPNALRPLLTLVKEHMREVEMSANF